MNDISERIKKSIDRKGVSYGYLSKITHIPKSAIQRYATGQTDKIPLDRLEKLAVALGVSAEHLMGWDDSTPATTPAPDDVNEVASAYAALETEAEKNMIRRALNLSEIVRESKPVFRIIPLLGTAAAAGPGEFDTGIPWEDYEVPADSMGEFAVRVSGDSMEPVLHDGQIALCMKRRPEIGDICVMMVNGAMLIKQFITDGRNIYLRSINRARKDADVDIWESGNDRVQCYGIVLLSKRPPLVDQ